MNRPCLTYFAAILLLLAASHGRAQSLFGFPGLVTVPSAEFHRDGAFHGGAAFIARERLSYSNFQYDGLVIFTSLTFLPYMEVNLKFTKQLGLPARAGHTADRSPSVRFKLLNERKNRPAFVLGIHDVFSTVDDGHARHFGATYLVATKHFFSPSFMIVPSLGYGFTILDGREKELVGLFGGVKVRCIHFRPVALLLDYDTHYVNVGLDIYAARFARLKVGLTNFHYFVANASMHFNLFDVF